jgi:hypothetical protein
VPQTTTQEEQADQLPGLAAGLKLPECACLRREPGFHSLLQAGGDRIDDAVDGRNVPVRCLQGKVAGAAHENPPPHRIAFEQDGAHAAADRGLALGSVGLARAYELRGHGLDRFVGHRRGDQADLESTAGVDGVAPEQHLQPRLHAHFPHQSLRSAGARAQTESDLAGCELAVEGFARDPQVARERELEAAAQTLSADGGDGRDR